MYPSWCSSKKLQLLMVALAVITVITILIILFFATWPSFARKQIIENVIFKDGTIGMQRFQNTSDLSNLRLSFSIFNVINVDQVIRSAAKVKLEEIGPFVYHEFKWKEIIYNDNTTGLITFKLRRRFIFKPELSVGNPATINVTWPNVPVLAAITLLNRKPYIVRNGARLLLETMMAQIGEKPFMTDSVNNFIFSGSHRELFARLYTNPVVRRVAGKKWPLPDNKFAILYNRNNTWLPDKDYIFSVAAGYGSNQTYADLNQYVYMNGSTLLPFWNSYGDCNRLGGTDGEFFSPFMDPKKNLSVYSMDICRTLLLKSSKPAKIDGIPVNLFTLDERSLQSPVKNPDNACYCLETNQSGCHIDGLIDLSKCVADSVYASGSHFLYGSPELLDRLDGIRPPNSKQDAPKIYIEPNTGSAIQVKVPIQFNVKMARNDYSMFSFFQDINPLYVPLLTVTEAAELDVDQAAMLRAKLLILDSWLISLVLGGSILLIILIVTAITVLCMRQRSHRYRSSVPSERDPLLGRGSIRERHDEARGQSQDRRSQKQGHRSPNQIQTHQKRSPSPSASRKLSTSSKSSGKSP